MSPSSLAPFLLLLVVAVSMADFPPNLEDGEKWLPSDIYEEIIYGYKSTASEALLANNSKEDDAVPVLDESRKLTTNSTNVGANGVAVADNPLPFQAASGISPTHSQIESLEHGAGTSRVFKMNTYFWPVYVKGSRGTGVFIPRAATFLQKENKSSKGTGVFLQPFSIDASTPIFKKKKSTGKNGEGTEDLFVTKKERMVSTVN